MISNVANLVRRRDLLIELVRGDLEARTARSSFGWLWWILDPLILMLIYWGVVAGVLGRGREEYAPYPVFVLCSLVTWKHFAGSAASAASALRSKEGLIRSVPFPTMVLPISTVIAKFVLFVAGFAVFVAAALLWPNAHHSGNWLAAVQVFGLMGIQVALVIGISLFLSCAGVFVPDLPDLLSHLLRIAYYLSPGLYGVELIRERLSDLLEAPVATWAYELYMLNPFAILITGYRDAILYGRFLEPVRWLALIAITVVILALGYRFYQRFDRRVIKLL